MLPLSVMALFCEDIREEKNDQVTLVGLFPDTVQVDMLPNGIAEGQAVRFMAKLCVYVRINFDPGTDIGEPQVWLSLPDGGRLSLGTIGADVVAKSRSESEAKDTLLAGVISRVVLGGFRPPQGTIRVEVDVKGTTHLAGAMKFNHSAANA
ncbi:MAG: hypothetical protein KIT20_02055 [Alphaproteobacteria bacterium]|nr:hypothetical protein [Alphaproteobacteria bacterium]